MKFYEVTGSLSEPIKKVHEWIEEAENKAVSLPHAMNISSVNAEGKPSSRMVLLKRISPEGLVFFTDYEGNKGKQIQAFPFVALTFWWAKTNKQIRIEGTCQKVSDEENDEYFSSRPRGSQISASVSLQSQELESYETLVQQSQVFEDDHLNKDILRPKRWGGFLVEPESIEFWIDQKNRLHKRELYRIGTSGWKKTLLSP
jgi:pyridoxamine 5'-phosphate oxidase